MPWNKVMDKWKAGTLTSGGGGGKVRSQKQAIAIMLAEKRKAAAGHTEYAATPAVKVPRVKRSQATVSLGPGNRYDARRRG